MVVGFCDYIYDPEQEHQWQELDTEGTEVRMLARSPDGLFLCQITKATSDVVVDDDHEMKEAQNGNKKRKVVSAKRRSKKRTKKQPKKLDDGASPETSDEEFEPSSRKNADTRRVEHSHMVGNPLTNEWKVLSTLNTRLVPTYCANAEGGFDVSYLDEYMEEMVMVTSTGCVAALLVEIDKNEIPWVTPAICSIEGESGWQLKRKRKLGTSSTSQMKRILASCSLCSTEILFHALRPGSVIAYNVVNDKAVYAELGTPDFDTQFPAWTVARQGQIYMFGSLWETDELSGEFYEHKRLAAWKVNWKTGSWELVSETTCTEMEVVLKDSTGYAFVFVKEADCVKLMIKGSTTALTFDFDKHAWGTFGLRQPFQADPSFQIHVNMPLPACN